MKVTSEQYIEMLGRLNRNKLRESPAQPDSTSESDLHEKILAYCRERLWPVVHSRMDRATTNALGVPDFVIAASDGRVLWVEVKSSQGKLRPEQAGFKVMLEMHGHVYHLVTSMRRFLDIVA